MVAIADNMGIQPKSSKVGSSDCQVHAMVMLYNRLKNSETAYLVSCERGDSKHVTDMWYRLVLKAHFEYENLRKHHEL